MTRIREEVTICAPAGEVWNAVHVDLENLPRWAGYVKRAEALDGRPGKNWRVRYELELPGGFTGAVILLHTEWDPPRRCAGRFDGGPLRGDWSYTYSEQPGATDLLYEMDYQLTGVLRFAGGILKNQYAEGIRQAMESLKRYLEEERRRPAVKIGR
jgi:Polyketide cyclase / dehydrase and lipid transport